jgi:hypothetical protein
LAIDALPHAEPEQLAEIPLAGTDGKARNALPALARRRGQTVEDVLRESVAAEFSQRSFSDIAQVAGLLKGIGLDVSGLDREFRALAPMIRRRHQIVHRTDKGENLWRGPATLTLAEVNVWRRAAERLIKQIERRLEAFERKRAATALSAPR